MPTIPTAITPLPTAPSRADPANFAARADAFLGALAPLVTELNNYQSATYTNALEGASSATSSASSASSAAASAASAGTSANTASAAAISAVNAPGAQGTSTTSHNIGTGSKTFTTQSGKAWIVGQWVLISNSASAANYMVGYITAYSGTSLTVQVESTGGTGTGVTTWNISLAAPSTDAVLNAQLVEHMQHALDLAGIAARRVVVADVASTAHEEVLIRHINHLADLVGVVARAIAGGDIILRRGTVADPSLHIADDHDTGLWSPAADSVAVSTAGQEALRVTSDRRLGIGTTAPTGLLDVNDNKVRVRTAQTPASAGATGNAGEIAWDANYLYICTATNTWRRVAHATWP